MRIINLTGKKFGRLRVLEKTKERKWGNVVYLCLCDCGKLKKVVGYLLTTGNTKSCGCLKREIQSRIKDLTYIKHGDARNPSKARLYITWKNMKGRCFNPNADNYKYYGAKGISVCEDWRNNYQAFKFWATLNGYKEKLEIDRIDPLGNYEPSNCQWITAFENRSKAIKDRSVK